MRGDALCYYRECGSRGITPYSPEYRVKGGDNVRTIKAVIKLLEVATNFVRALTDLIRESKR